MNSPDHAQIAHEVAQHYIMLARELIMEEVRKNIAPDAPSRQKCLWAIETLEQAKYWQQRLGGESQIAQLELNGIILLADARLLLGDSEPLSTTYESARTYWRGEISDNPEPEILFQGTATVVQVGIS